MEMIGYNRYLKLLQQLGETLAGLAVLEREKTNAVRQDDLAALNECMKKEQALCLALRGYEQKRTAAVTALNLTGVPLSGLAARCPEDCRAEAKKVAEDLLRQYQLYQGAAEVARSTLECNLHQIEKVLSGMGSEANAGYRQEAPEPELPQSMKTDFRA